MKGRRGTVILGERNPATNDVFWQAEVVEDKGDTLVVEIEDGRIGVVKSKDFTPRYFYDGSKK